MHAREQRKRAAELRRANAETRQLERHRFEVGSSKWNCVGVELFEHEPITTTSNRVERDGELGRSVFAALEHGVHDTPW